VVPSKPPPYGNLAGHTCPPPPSEQHLATVCVAVSCKPDRLAYLAGEALKEAFLWVAMPTLLQYAVIRV
jgi:hypothetical protein